jgi:hypothetical protein
MVNGFDFILFSILLIIGLYIYKKDWYSQKGFYHYFRVIIHIVLGLFLVGGFLYLVVYGFIRYFYKHFF